MHAAPNRFDEQTSMDTDHINEMITTALAIEADKGHLANYLEDRASASGLVLGESQRREAIAVFEKYVRSVPTLLASAANAARGTPVEDTLGRVIRAAVTYWDEPDDLVPDELGLLGLLDDAYFTLRMLQLVSERLRTDTGQALLADDLSALDAVVREMLGEIADVLDELVSLSMTNAGVDELVAKLQEYSGSFVLQSAASSFTGMSIEALVDEHLAFATNSDELLFAEIVAALRPGVAALRELGGTATLATLGEALAGTRTAVERILTMAKVDDAEDRDGLVNLLVGALLARVASGGELDDAFIERAVDIVLATLG